MLLSEIKHALLTLHNVAFKLENGAYVPEHFHVTEVGIIEKRFIDCGGTLRSERVANFQLWDANDYDHRLKPEKLLNIIKLSEENLGITDDLNVEVEYQGETIGKYGLQFDGDVFVLTHKQTSCLAQDKCGIPLKQKTKVSLSELSNPSPECTPNSGCCS